MGGAAGDYAHKHPRPPPHGRRRPPLHDEVEKRRVELGVVDPPNEDG